MLYVQNESKSEEQGEEKEKQVSTRELDHLIARTEAQWSKAASYIRR